MVGLLSFVERKFTPETFAAIKQEHLATHVGLNATCLLFLRRGLPPAVTHSQTRSCSATSRRAVGQRVMLAPASASRAHQREHHDDERGDPGQFRHPAGRLEHAAEAPINAPFDVYNPFAKRDNTGFVLIPTTGYMSRLSVQGTLAFMCRRAF